jgi:hypothetical protein
MAKIIDFFQGCLDLVVNLMNNDDEKMFNNVFF